MPIDVFPIDAGAITTVVPSAPTELCVVLYACSVGRSEPTVVLPPALLARANAFWDDGYPSLAEIVLLADATGTLEDLEIEPFLDRIAHPVVLSRPPALETESNEERAIILSRLERLASDRSVRTRFVRMLRDVWAHIEPTWESTGRARALEVSASWSARLAVGTPAIDLCPEHHIARRRSEFAPMVAAAQREGTLLLTPSVAGIGHIIALPGRLALCVDASGFDPVVTRREIAVEISERLKALADPTRLTILAQLAHAPAGVSQLARTLHIAQPTASVHLRQLRIAGLVDGRRDGSRTIYSVRPDAVETLLSSVNSQIAHALVA
jgi:DNA-binding transcriptional ArsR family regulator